MKLKAACRVILVDHPKVKRLNYTEDMSCLRRAITAALRFAGRDDDTSWIPANATCDLLPEICDRYGVHWIGRNGPETFDPGNRPVVAIYDAEAGETNGRPNHHAVFCSDLGPCSRWKLSHLLMGWERREDT